MIGLDCNILVQLAFSEHPAHAATVAAVQGETLKGERLVFPSLVATEFLHVVTDGRRFSPPLTMPEALAWLDTFLSSPHVGVVAPTSESLRLTLAWMREYNLGRKRILDTHLAAILYSHGVTRLLTSNPSDFSVFVSMQIATP